MSYVGVVPYDGPNPSPPREVLLPMQKIVGSEELTELVKAPREEEARRTSEGPREPQEMNGSVTISDW